MKKWKWLLVNGCECNSQICTVTEFLNSCQGGKNASMGWGITFKNNIIASE
jgi:hypothetical protein